MIEFNLVFFASYTHMSLRRSHNGLDYLDIKIAKSKVWLS